MPTATATSRTNLCAGIFSPGYWENYQNHYSDAQFYALLKATVDFGATFAAEGQSAAIAQAETILQLQGSYYVRSLLTAELNVAAQPSLGTGTYTPVSTTTSINALLAQAYADNGSGNQSPYTNGSLASNDTALIDYLSGGGEGDSGSSCLVGSTPPPPVPTPTGVASCSTGITSIQSNFNGTGIAGGNYIWFNSVFKPTPAGALQGRVVTYFFTNQFIDFTANSTPYHLSVPNAIVTFSPFVTTATTVFSTTGNTWVTTVPMTSTALPGNTFLSGLAFPVPLAGLPGGINPVTWSGNLSSDTPGVSAQWQWAAAVNTLFSTTYNNLGVKPVDANYANPYLNSDHAGTPENLKGSVTGGATGGGGSNYTGSYSGTGVMCQVSTATPEAPSSVLFGAGAALMLAVLGRRARRSRRRTAPPAPSSLD